jgi:hypothetical protein
MVGEKDLEKQNTEAFLNYVINELSVRLRESKRNRKEKEAALHDKKLNQKLKGPNSDKKTGIYPLWQIDIPCGWGWQCRRRRWWVLFILERFASQLRKTGLSHCSSHGVFDC